MIAVNNMLKSSFLRCFNHSFVSSSVSIQITLIRKLFHHILKYDFIILAKTTGCSKKQKCPAPLITASPAFGIISSISFASEIGVAVSLSPHISYTSCFMDENKGVKSSLTAFTIHCFIIGEAFL